MVAEPQAPRLPVTGPIPPPRRTVDRYQRCLRWREPGRDGWLRGALVRITDNGGETIAYWGGATKLPPWMTVPGDEGSTDIRQEGCP